MNFRNRFCAWLMLWTRLMLWTSLGVLALERVSQAQPSYGGSRPVTNATELLPFNFEAATSFIALVICCVVLTDAILTLTSLRFAMF